MKLGNVVFPVLPFAQDFFALSDFFVLFAKTFYEFCFLVKNVTNSWLSLQWICKYNSMIILAIFY